MGNARRWEPRPRSSSQSNSALTAKVAQLETQMSQMSQFLQSLAWSGVPMLPFPSLTFKPIQPQHGHHTFAPVDNAQTSEPHLPNDQVDFQTLFD
ncbi:hypothetical protein ACE6H2_001609 [Prunus campanulata]